MQEKIEKFSHRLVASRLYTQTRPKVDFPHAQPRFPARVLSTSWRQNLRITKALSSLPGYENQTLIFIIDGDAKSTKETHSEQWVSVERAIVDEIDSNILDDGLSHLD